MCPVLNKENKIKAWKHENEIKASKHEILLKPIPLITPEYSDFYRFYHIWPFNYDHPLECCHPFPHWSIFVD